MVTGIVLVVLAVACRLLSPALHMWNFVPAGAIALYAGARLPRRWAWAVPIAAMLISDQLLGYGDQWPLFGMTRLTVYGTLAATTWLGLAARGPRVRPWMLPGLAVGASTLFFVTTNFTTWLEGVNYPLTFAGLVECYVKAIPFHKQTMAADLIGTCVLFGIGPVIERAAARVLPSRGRPAVEKPATVELTEVV